MEGQIKFDVVKEGKKEFLTINGRKVLRGWESFNGFYWFALEEVQKQDSVINGKVYKGDQIYYGLCQLHENEFGDFSETEIKLLGARAWEIPQRNLVWSGRRN